MSSNSSYILILECNYNTYLHKDNLIGLDDILFKLFKLKYEREQRMKKRKQKRNILTRVAVIILTVVISTVLTGNVNIRHGTYCVGEELVVAHGPL